MILFLSTSFGLHAQYVVPHGEFLNVNNVNALYHSVGNHFFDFQGDAQYEFPIQSGTKTIFTQVLWVGGKDDTENIHLCGERFRQSGYDYVPGPILLYPALDTMPNCHTNWNKLWRVDLSEIETFLVQVNNPAYPNYQIPQSLIDWPAQYDSGEGHIEELAPYIDVNDDGNYNPEDGDYPQIRGDQCLFFVFNDYRVHTESGGLKMGLEVRGMAYAFYVPGDDAFNNTTFLHYEIINRSDSEYHDSYIGLFTDFDIGYPIDDYIGCEVNRSCFYAYNGDANDESAGGFNGYGINPPAQAAVLLGGPFLDSDGVDNPQYDEFQNQLVDESINGMNFQDEIIDNERYGMTGFFYFNNAAGNPATYDPGPNALEYYNYLSGYWLDGSHLYYGGTGHLSSSGANENTPAKFAFPGNPSSDTYSWGTDGVVQDAWSEETEGNPPADRRGVCSSGPFTFLPGATHEIDIAFVSGVSVNTKSSSVDVMKQNIDIIHNGFVNNITPAGKPFIVSGIPSQYSANDFSVSIFPNPANNNLTLDLNSNKNSTVSVQILDINGRVYLASEISVNSGNTKTSLDISSLAAGVYFVAIDNGNVVTNKKLVVLR